MLTDVALKALKPKNKVYKVSDRDGMYVRVTPTGLISFSLDYRLNGRRETVYLGRYGRDGISLARATDFDWSCALILEDTRKDYGEPRYQALGLIDDRLYMLVFTPRASRVHVISLRKANDREKRRYEETKTQP